MIDVGGPSMLRGAAKNFAHVRRSAGPTQYEPVLAELRANGELSLETRRRLAAEAFATPPPTRRRSRRGSPTARRSRRCFTGVREGASTSRTARTRTSAPPTTPSAASRRHLLSRVEQLHGRELSFNNLNDLVGRRLLVREFALPACVIVKHANPCGVASARRSRRRTSGRSRPTRSRPTAASSCSTARSTRARGAAGRAVRRGAVRARLRRGRARGAAARKK